MHQQVKIFGGPLLGAKKAIFQGPGIGKNKYEQFPGLFWNSFLDRAATVYR